MTDLFDKCAASMARADEMRATRSFPYGKPVQGRRGAEIVVDGREVIMAGSNDYLGLSGDPRVVAGAVAAVEKYGASCTGAPIMTGTIALHRELEERLAAFLGREAAVVATTGFQTNLALATLLGRGDAVFADMENHASLVDAARLGFSTHRRYRHNDTAHLERLLAAGEPGGGRLIVTDGLFSMEGDVCHLPALVGLAGRYGARLAVDCAHDIGLLGPGGRGVPALFGLETDVDIVTGTFSKCFGSTGGFIAADRGVVDFLRHHARSIVFSAGLPPASAGAALAALEILESEPEHRTRVLALAARLRAGLLSAGLRAGGGDTPIIPVHVGGDFECRRLWWELLEEGVLTNAVSSPGVPVGRELIRLCVTAAHTDEHVDRIADAFARAAKRTGFGTGVGGE